MASPPTTSGWERFSFLIPKRLKDHISEFQFQNYIHTRGEAIRRLIKSGLLREKEEGNYLSEDSFDFDENPPTSDLSDD